MCFQINNSAGLLHWRPWWRIKTWWNVGPFIFDVGSKNNTALKYAQGHFFKRNENNQVGKRQHCCIVRMATGPHMTRSWQVLAHAAVMQLKPLPYLAKDFDSAQE